MRYSNSNPQVKLGNFPWYEMLWRSIRGDFKPRNQPAHGYSNFAEKWSTEVQWELISQRQEQALVTWLGHVSLLLQVDCVNILIDPTLAKRAGPLGLFGAKRQVKAPLQANQLPTIDIVLISHNHYDHLCYATISQLLKSGQNPHFYVPVGLKKWFTRRGITQVTEMNWYDKLAINSNLNLYFTPAQHWSRRSITDTNASLWGGYIIEKKLKANNSQLTSEEVPWRFYFPGDTGYNQDFVQIREKIGVVDFIALPIGAYLPRDFMKSMHVNPADALTLMQDLGAKQAMGVHWGTFELTQEAFDQPPIDLAQALAAKNLPQDTVWLLKHGESRYIE